jgi:hypothetical protein
MVAGPQKASVLLVSEGGKGAAVTAATGILAMPVGHHGALGVESAAAKSWLLGSDETHGR